MSHLTAISESSTLVGNEPPATVRAPEIEPGVGCNFDSYLLVPNNVLDERIAAVKARLGEDAVILGHHYQRDEVVKFANFRGDSLKLCFQASEAHARYIVFCAQVARVRREHPGIRVIVHPECRFAVAEAADQIASTEGIIQAIESAPPGSPRAVGTEIHLVHRRSKGFKDRKVISLDPHVCVCTTMFRITPQHLLWALENLDSGAVVNRISVDERARYYARLARDRMLSLR